MISGAFEYRGVANDLANGGDVRRNYGSAARQGFERRQAKALADRREQQKIRSVVGPDKGLAVHDAQVNDPAGESQPGDQSRWSAVNSGPSFEQTDVDTVFAVQNIQYAKHALHIFCTANSSRHAAIHDPNSTRADV